MKLKLRSSVRFLASIFDGVGTSVRRDGLATYVDLDYTKFEALASFDPTQKQVAAQDTVSGEWNRLPLSLLLVSNQYTLQQVATASGTVSSSTTLLIVNRDNPASTAITLPSVASRAGRHLSIVDYSTNVSAHDIALSVAVGGENIMRQTSWHINSNAASLGSVTLRPIIELNAWVIAP